MEIDILNIDKIIREKWKVSDETITDIDKKIDDINSIIIDKKLSVHVINDLNNQIKTLQKTKDDYSNFQNNMNYKC